MNNNKEKKSKKKNPIEIKVIQGNAQTKEQIEKIFQKAREMSDVENKPDVDIDSLEGIEKIKAYDSNFTEKSFLNGAKKAYQWIYDFINKDNEEGIKQIASPKIYAYLIEMLNELDLKNEQIKIEIEFEKEPEIVDCRTVAKTAFIDVKYSVKEKRVYVDKESSKVVSEKENKLNVVWTWAKNMTSTDPNWQLERMTDV